MPHNATELEMAQYETAKYCHSMVDTDIAFKWLPVFFYKSVVYVCRNLIFYPN